MIKPPSLIPHWRRAWRMASVQVSLLIVAWVALPPDAQAAVVGLLGVPPDKVPGLLALLGIAARLVAQPALQADPPAQEPAP